MIGHYTWRLDQVTKSEPSSEFEEGTPVGHENALRTTWWQSPACLVVSFVLCFPIGLFIIWTNANWTRSRKIRWTCGLVAYLLFCGAIGQKKEPESNPIPNESKVLSSEKQIVKSVKIAASATPTAEPDSLSLANGRPVASIVLDRLKKEGVVFHTPASGTDPSGTPFAELFQPVVRGPCRIHVGGRDNYGRKFSIIVAESADNSQVCAVIIGSPFDPRKPVERGNDASALAVAVKNVLPECDIYALISENALQLSTGGTAVAHHGKAVLRLTRQRNEMQAFIVTE